MTTIALENLQGWVSADWNQEQADQQAKMTLSRAQALAAPQ